MSSKLAIRIGVWLMIAALAVLAAYTGYVTIAGIFTEPDTPIAIQVAIPALVAGSLILLAAAFVQKMKRRKQEDVEEVEY